jgi:hypothetical protein
VSEAPVAASQGRATDGKNTVPRYTNFTYIKRYGFCLVARKNWAKKSINNMYVYNANMGEREGIFLVQEDEWYRRQNKMVD